MRLGCALIFASTCWSGVALAYSDPTLFARDPSSDPAGGGGGIYFTGSPRFFALDCSVCHVGGPTDVTLLLSALEDGEVARLFEEGYQPGVVYQIEVAFAEDRLAPTTECLRSSDEPCDLNLFALEIVDAVGSPAGQLCPVKPSESEGTGACAGCRSLRAGGTVVQDSCTVVLADGFDDVAFGWRNGVTAYSFFWRAPMEDAGALRAYVSGVDGRGPETENGELTSYTNDGTVALAIPLRSPSSPIESNCATGPADGEAWLLGLWVLLLRARTRAQCAASDLRAGADLWRSLDGRNDGSADRGP